MITPGRTLARRCTRFDCQASSKQTLLGIMPLAEDSYGVETAVVDASVSAAARAWVV